VCCAQVDICPEHVLKHTLSSLQLILRKPGVKKRPFMVRTQADVLTCARHIDSDALAPIFLTSSVTGTSQAASMDNRTMTTVSELLPRCFQGNQTRNLRRLLAQYLYMLRLNAYRSPP